MKLIQKSSSKERLLFLLPGRGMNPSIMSNWFNAFYEQYLVVTIDPEGEWYPAPKGPSNQSAAVEGVERKTIDVVNFIRTKTEELGYELDAVALVGFSAGAVIALEVSFLLKQISFVISCSGAILDVYQVRDLTNISTKYFLIHGMDDSVFSWKERFLPTQKLLTDSQLQVTCLTSNLISHEIHRGMIDACLNLFNASIT